MNQETQTIFERLLIERSIVTPEQLAHGRRLLVELKQRGKAITLLDVLLDQDMGDRAKLRDTARLAMIRSGAERVSIGGFELLEKAGQGGMGAVYRATQTKIGRFVALKLMRPKLAKDERYLGRFVREARASAQLSHPNIVQGIDAGQDKGYYYFAMEFVDGDTLRRILQREKVVSEQYTLNIGVQMAKALAAAHKAGLVHRDVKPENILIEKATGVAKLADLGLAKSTEPTDTSVTQAGVALGTPNYISPEQARGDEQIDIRSDIYSLGATLYHLATGTLPFDGESPPVIMSRHIKAPLDPPHLRNPNVSQAFSSVIQKMMAKKVSGRYQTPDELLADLGRIGRGEAPAAVAPSRRARRRRSVVATSGPPMAPVAIGLSIVAFIGLLIFLFAMFGRSGGEGGGGTSADAAFARAVKLIAEQPVAFKQIIPQLQRSIDIEPNGAHAETARSLLSIAEQFQSIAAAPRRTPDAWAQSAAALKALAETSPTKPSYRDGIYAYMRTVSRELMSDAMRDAVSNPTRIPKASAWLDAVAQGSPGPVIGDEAAGQHRELVELLRKNADHFLDKYAGRAEVFAEQGKFGEAIKVLRSSVPATLATPMLQSLIDKRVEVVRERAQKYVAARTKDIRDMLDGGAAERARAHVDHLKATLGLPEYAGRIAALDRTVAAAPSFLPMFDKLKALHAAKPRDAGAVGALALKLRKKHGRDTYVAGRLKPFTADIDRLLAGRALDRKLGQAEVLVKAGKSREADALLVEVLKSPVVSDAQRTRAVKLRVAIGMADGLPALLFAGLKKVVPVKDLRLRLEGQAAPAVYNITAVTRKQIDFETSGRKGRLAWDQVAYVALRDLARGRLKLVADDNAEGLYHLGVKALGEDIVESRKLLEMAVTEAKKRTLDEMPGRDALVRSAEGFLLRLTEKEAERAMARLRATAVNIRTVAELDRAVAAWQQVQTVYGATTYIKAQAEELKKIGSGLSETVVRLRCGSVMQQIDKSDWSKLVPRLQQALADTEKIAPLAKERRKAIESLIDFGRKFVVEELFYRQVFGTLPWRSDALDALEKHKDKAVAGRAARYRKIFEHDVNQRADVKEQRRYATWERHGETREHVRDLSLRLARHNAVYRYWRRKEREACYGVEVDVAYEFRFYGISGNCMSIIMMEQFLKLRRRAPASVRASAEYARLQGFVRSADRYPVLRTYAIQRGKQAMKEHGGTDDFAVRFCLVVAEQYEAAGDDANALRYFEKLVNARSSKWSHFQWHGYLGRGRIRERAKRYESALSDYDTALQKSKGWNHGHRCAKHIVNLCMHSGNLNRPTRAQKAVDDVLKRAGHPSHIARTRALLNKKK
jgi:eukaryotic-like serine/threonine-protein kinase